MVHGSKGRFDKVDFKYSFAMDHSFFEFGRQTPGLISKNSTKLTSSRNRVARLKSIKIPHQDLKNPRMQHIFSKNPEIFLRCSDDVIYHRDEILTSVQRLFNFSILCNIVILRIKAATEELKFCWTFLFQLQDKKQKVTILDVK